MSSLATVLLRDTVIYTFHPMMIDALRCTALPHTVITMTGWIAPSVLHALMHEGQLPAVGCTRCDVVAAGSAHEQVQLGGMCVLNVCQC